MKFSDILNFLRSDKFKSFIRTLLNLFLKPSENEEASQLPVTEENQEHTSENQNRTMMQMFEWYLPNDGNHFNTLAGQAKELADNGITMAWLPPAYKGQNGSEDVGYGVYDTYDLGEFDQKGSVRTKYGTKSDYLKAIRSLHKEKIEVLCDIVLNHRMGADYPEDVMAYVYDTNNRKCVNTDGNGNPRLIPIKAWTGFSFAGRQGVHSSFKWNASHFSGVDYNASQPENGKVYLFEGKSWDDDVDGENGNFDYLMGADIDLSNEEVFNELVSFGMWYLKETDMDGFRLDAVKHMCAPFYKDWVSEMRKRAKKELFTVGEYWSADLNSLRKYIHDTEGAFSLFDVPLHMKFYEASHANGNFDMGSLFNNTLTGTDSWHSVTFVDNHDTQPGQALGTFVNRWFKEIAYAIILLEEKGIPCVFYGDYYGIPHDHLAPVDNLKKLISLRKTHAYGTEHDYYDDRNVVGFTREGNKKSTGLALLCTDKDGGRKWMYVGKSHAGQTFIDALGHRKETITINQDGYGEFMVNGGSVSVWIPLV